MPSGDVWKVIFEWRWGTVQCRPGFYLVEGGGGSDPDPTINVYNSVVAALTPAALAGFSDQSSITGLTIVDIQPGIRPTASIGISPLVGDQADDNPLPPQSAGVISLKTGVKGSVGVYAAAGRMYLPGMPQNGQISGFLQESFQNTLNAFAGRLQVAYIDDATDYQWHVVSLTPGSRPVAVRAINPVTFYTVNNVVRSQRRREFGVGI